MLGTLQRAQPEDQRPVIAAIRAEEAHERMSPIRRAPKEVRQVSEHQEEDQERQHDAGHCIQYKIRGVTCNAKDPT